MGPATASVTVTVHRTACVDVYSLPLQLLLRRLGAQPTAQAPVAVVTEDKPLGTVTAVNRTARQAGVRTGMRYAAALAMASNLQAGTVPEEEIGSGIAGIEEVLHRFTPVVEPASLSDGDLAEAGVFWLSIGGLRRHYRSVDALARTVVAALQDEGFYCSVVAGFSRFGTYALAKELASRRQPYTVVADAESERQRARELAIEHLPLAPEARDVLERLDVLTVGDFLELPFAELLRRFGPEVGKVFAFASGELDLPVQGVAQLEKLTRRRRLQARETYCERLCRHCTDLLASLLAELTQRDSALVELEIGLLLENGHHHSESIRPAIPTLRADRLEELIQLRLGVLTLEDAVEAISLDVLHTPLVTGQSELFHQGGRDLSGGAEAFARIRAEFGNSVIVQAILQSSHLPEGQFSWEPMLVPSAPTPAPASAAGSPHAHPTHHMVRRMLASPLPVSPPDTGRRRMWGPFLVSGGWWGETNDRAYYFALTDEGDLQWLFRERGSGRWYLQGWVE